MQCNYVQAQISFVPSSVLGSTRDTAAIKLLGPIFVELHVWIYRGLLQAAHHPEFKYNGNSGAQGAKDNIMEEMGTGLF